MNTLVQENKLLLLTSPGTLAQVIAREAAFGTEIMALCTPLGTKELRALPQEELMRIKKAMFQAHPCTDPDRFDSEVWSICHTAIEQDCGRARRLAQKKNIHVRSHCTC